MPTTTDPQSPLSPLPSPPGNEPSDSSQPVDSSSFAEQSSSEVHQLLQQLQETSVSPTTSSFVLSQRADDQLVRSRLGVGAGLFSALHCRQAATANHALRVALSASAWALYLNMDDASRDVLEVAALLHNIGMIGMPDYVLLHPAESIASKKSSMMEVRQKSLEILGRSCSSHEVLEIVGLVPAWFDGSVEDFRIHGTAIPQGARMIAIAKAFDAMTMAYGYEQALPLENAMAELFQRAGTQYDPDLIRQFAEYHLIDQRALHEEVASRWLNELDPDLIKSYWHLDRAPSTITSVSAMFQAKLLENMYDGVVFIDAKMRIQAWNHGAERLTGIDATDIRQYQWRSELLDMCDETGQLIKEADCPVYAAIHSGVQTLRRMMIRGRGDRKVPVDTHTIPVTDDVGAIAGAVLLLHDASSEISLEHRCQMLYDRSTKDALTQVANRAEFDRVLTLFVEAHRQQEVPCAMFICDLDFFKQVNDTYGHQAGDEAIKTLANLLKTSCRPGDLVARYGGEEFVMLCADCNNTAAAHRAEQIRLALSQLSQPALKGQVITASFGVTDAQPGDTPASMLHRADRRLLHAKAKGRNQVVFQGNGIEPGTDETQPRGFSLFKRQTVEPQLAFEQNLVTSVPFKIVIEKVRGFVADHQVNILGIDENNLCFEVNGVNPETNRRYSDRPISFLFDVRFVEERIERKHDKDNYDVRTHVQVLVSPKGRDRRLSGMEEQANQLLASFRGYLMAALAEEESPDGKLRRVKRILAPWLVKY